MPYEGAGGMKTGFEKSRGFRRGSNVKIWESRQKTNPSATQCKCTLYWIFLAAFICWFKSSQHRGKPGAHHLGPELFIYLFISNRQDYQWQQNSKFKSKCELSKKTTIGCNRQSGVKDMAVTHGEYTLCCQVTLRKAALNKGLSRPTRRVRAEETFDDGLKVTSASGRLPT